MSEERPIRSLSSVHQIAQLARGVKLIADAVKPTLGPKGRFVRISMPDGAAYMTKSGSLVAESVKPTGQWQAMGVKLMRMAAAGANNFGDGTTTTAVLTQSILGDCIKAIAAKTDPLELLVGVDSAIKISLDEIKKQAKEVMTPEELFNVGTISADGDAEVGMIVARAFIQKAHTIRILGLERMAVEYKPNLRFHNDFFDHQFSWTGNNPHFNLHKRPDGIAIITVRGDTTAETLARGWRLYSALNAAQAALTYGIVPGGGVALLHASKALDEVAPVSKAQKMGVEIVQRAMRVPLRQLVQNAGVKSAKVADSLLHDEHHAHVGYDVETSSYTDMIAAGIIDPAKVVVKGLEEAGSMASAFVMPAAMLQPGGEHPSIYGDNQYLRFLQSEVHSKGRLSKRRVKFGGGEQTTVIAGGSTTTASDGGDDSPPDSNLATTIAQPAHFVIGDFPERVGKEEVANLTVYVSNTAHGHAGKLDELTIPKEGLRLEVFVEADGFEFIGPTHASILVPEVGDSAGVSFRLKATTEGSHVIRITVCNGGTPVGGLALNSKVGSAVGSSSSSPSPSVNSIMRSLRGAAGDVGILLQQDPTTHEYSFTWIDEVGIRDTVYQNKPFTTLSDFIANQIEDVQKIVRQIYERDPSEVEDTLKSRAITWWKELIPLKIREEFISNHKKIRRINIFSPGDPFPWEALYPFQANPLFDHGFLVEQVEMCRWMTGPLPPSAISLRRADFVVPSEDLKDAETEIGNLIALLAAWNALDSSRIIKQGQLHDLFKRARVSLLHFACHNAFEKQGGQIMVNRAPITPNDFTTYEGVLGQVAPLVFLNACRTDGQSPGYTSMGGWAKCFLRTGAGAFIGTLWEVSDKMSQMFAETLYRELLEDKKSFGEALKAARIAVKKKSPGDPTWLAYSFYGDISARIQKA